VTYRVTRPYAPNISEAPPRHHLSIKPIHVIIKIYCSNFEMGAQSQVERKGKLPVNDQRSSEHEHECKWIRADHDASLAEL
jgi:hypothetical protein